MQRKDYRGARCKKRKFSKCEGVCKTYNDIQSNYAERLNERMDIVSFEVNVPLDGIEEGEFTTDFVAEKTDGTFMVRECVWRKNIQRPRTLKLLDASRNYWRARGVEDWGIVIDAEKK